MGPENAQKIIDIGTRYKHYLGLGPRRAFKGTVSVTSSDLAWTR